VPRALRGRPRPTAVTAAWAATTAGLAVDLVPDFIPVAGQLDDAILVVLVLRTGGEEVLREDWPGPEPSRLLVQHPAFSR
jgi:uncharacterized membrane protein YkvA (DUF1232 family)